jgi:hypothetical protein
MSVHTSRDSLKVLAMIFEARYDEGYRFLDHTGELLVRIRRQHPSWTVNLLAQNIVSLINQSASLQLNVTVEKIDVSARPQVKISLSEAEKKARILGDAAEEFYNLTVEVLKVPRTIRVGARFVFLAPSDSLEEADRFMWKAAESPLINAIAEETKGQPTEAQLVCVLDDPQSGYRQRITLASALIEQKPEDPPFLGLPGDQGSGGVLVDIDTYTRPEETHLGKISMFFQENYLKSQSQAMTIFGWLLRHQK